MQPDRVMIALVRHGRTAWNAERRFLGVHDLPLDAVGLAQAARLGETWAGRFDTVYSSYLARAYQTAEALAPPKPVVLQGIHEVDQGQLEGLDGPTALAAFPEFFAAWREDPARARVPGGEQLEEARDRGLRAVLQVAGRHQAGEVLAVVSHQLVIASVCATVASAPLSRWRDFGLENTGIAWLSSAGRDLRMEEAP